MGQSLQAELRGGSSVPSSLSLFRKTTTVYNQKCLSKPQSRLSAQNAQRLYTPLSPERSENFPSTRNVSNAVCATRCLTLPTSTATKPSFTAKFATVASSDPRATVS